MITHTTFPDLRILRHGGQELTPIVLLKPYKLITFVWRLLLPAIRGLGCPGWDLIANHRGSIKVSEDGLSRLGVVKTATQFDFNLGSSFMPGCPRFVVLEGYEIGPGHVEMAVALIISVDAFKARLFQSLNLQKRA